MSKQNNDEIKNIPEQMNKTMSRIAEAFRKAFGISAGTTRVEILKDVDMIVRTIYREKKEIEQIKFKKTLYITSIVCTTVMVVAIVVSTFWGW